ncbi:alpha-L-fucosidase [Chitinophaga sp. NPDC101104]|uniref:alpha-L-fucosidase n=1 Tax=Chitinophaga sp. NPDC101104 TaxID=3390561 RepID=UPI003D01CE4C
MMGFIGKIGKCLPALLLGLPFYTAAQDAPRPVGPVPNARQIEWYKREMIAFFHFGMNTFTDDNEGDGTAQPEMFQPTALDCRQWTRVLKRAGIPSAILVAKHADGFCNWPSAHTDYSLKYSSWRNGKGDVVKEFTDACKADGIKAGIYLGPHDRHDKRYGTPQYADYYADQLSELLRNYGPIWEIWWDGAGADKLTEAFYTRWADTVRKLQPQCVVFGTKNSNKFADCRWNGNESGISGDPCWANIDLSAIRDEAQHIDDLNKGQQNGSAFVPAEADVSIRPSWFYHTNENGRVKTVRELWDIYFQSVGHNSVLLLNYPPDRRGLVHEIDAQRTDSLRLLIDGTFKNNLAKGAVVTSLHPRGGRFGAQHLLDGKPGTYYAGTDAHSTDTLVFQLPAAKTFDVIMLQEVIELGHRTTEWSVDYSEDGKSWLAIPEATAKQSVGYKWLIRHEPVKAKAVRLRITGGKACPALHTFGIYKEQFAKKRPELAKK